MPASTETAATDRSTRLNTSCFCLTLDRSQLCRALQDLTDDPGFCEKHVVNRPHLFSNVPVFLSRDDLAGMEKVVAAVDTISQMPAYVEKVLSWAPGAVRQNHGPRGALMGYDFHVGEEGPKLIEINTNAGGAVLNAVLAVAQYACCNEMMPDHNVVAPRGFAEAFVDMFGSEWRRQRQGQSLRRIAIVDDRPESQYLYPEFLLAQKMFLRAGIAALIADPRDLVFDGEILRAKQEPVDLVYNRLVDFALELPEHAALRAAYETGAVVVTPNPHNHAVLADKRNLIILSDPQTLAALGVAAELRAKLAAIPRTLLVTPETADEMWRRRKEFFFKPTRGHGSKAVYRGDKLTRGVWEEIVKGGYVAQAYAAPSERMIRIDGQEERRKLDVRLYVYGKTVLLAAARLYQGQATNFRTPGGGFAPVFTV